MYNPLKNVSTTVYMEMNQWYFCDDNNIHVNCWITSSKLTMVAKTFKGITECTSVTDETFQI